MTNFHLVAASIIMEACDDSPHPQAEPGEKLTDYWVRVLKYQVWNDAFAAGLDEDARVDNGYEPATNPYTKADL